MGQRDAFATELRGLRASAGLSLAELAQAAHVNRGYIGHVEHGQRWPSRSLAIALDGALDARGTLLAAWEAADAAATPAPADPDEFERFEQALADPRRTDTAVVAHLCRILAEQRHAEDALGPRRLLPRCSHSST